MARSGNASYTNNYLSYTNYADEYFTLSTEWEVDHTDAVTNSSIINVNYIFQSSIDCKSVSMRRAEFYLNGELYHQLGGMSGSVIELGSVTANTPLIVYSTTLEIPHESSAAQSFSLEWMFKPIITVGVSTAWNGDNVWTGEQYFLLDNIVRSAFITAILDGGETCTDEDGFTFYYVNPMGEEASLLQAALSISNGSEMELQYRDIDKTTDSYTFPMEDADWAKIYAKTLDKKVTDNIPVKIYLKSIVPGDDGLEEVVDTRSILMSYINYMPTLEPEFIDINPVTRDLTGNPEIFVSNASNVQFNLNADVKKQSTLKNYFASSGNNIKHELTGILEGVKNKEFRAYVEDSRGFNLLIIDEHTEEKGNWVEYVPLTCKVKNGLLDASGKLIVTVSGKYYGGSFGEVDNQLSLEYNIRKTGDGTYLPIYVSDSDVKVDAENNYTYTFEVEGFDYAERYYLSVRAKDKINTQGIVSSTIIGAIPVFDWGKDDFAFYVPVTINGAMVDSIVEEDKAIAYYMNSSGQYSSTGVYWNYRKWASGLLECWSTIPVTASINTAWGNMYVAATQYKTDLSYPVELKEKPLIIATLGAGATKGMLIADNSYAADNISTGRYNIASPVAITSSTTFYINYYVRGKWN